MTQSRLRKTSFAGDVFKLVSGTTVAQALAILVSPLLTRLYAPEAFGIAALFASIIAIINVLSCMRYAQAIMLPETDEKAANLLAVSLGFAILISLLTVPVVWFGQSRITNWLNAPPLAPYLWLVPPVVFVNGLFKALRSWNTRTKHFGRLSIAQVVASVVAAGSKVGTGFAGYATEGSLIGANALGTATATTVLGRRIWRDDGRFLQQSASWQGMINGLKRYRKFPLFGTWTGLLIMLSWQLPVLMLSAFFSPAVVGFYSLGNRVVRLPMMLVGRSVAQVFYQRAAGASQVGSLDVVVRQVYKRLVAYGLFPMLLLTLIGEELFVLVFGAEWAQAGVYTQILSVYMFFHFISRPLGLLYSVLEKQEVGLIVSGFLLASRFVALWFGGRTGNILFTVALFSLSGVLVYGAFSMWIVHASGIPLKEWWSVLLRYAFVSGAFLAGAWFVCSFLNLQSWSVLAVYGICTFGYYAWLSSRDKYVSRLARRLRARISWRKRK